MRHLKMIVFLTLPLTLSACLDDAAPAPVVDAWYQKDAASNFYVVRSGDTIYSIAFIFGLDYRDLVAANNLTPPYTVTPGQRIRMTHRPPQPLQNYSSSAAAAPSLITSTRANPQGRVVFGPHWHWPTGGRLLEGFSRNPAGHPGITIGGTLGQPVRATAAGEVVYSGDGVRGYGNLIIIKHSDRYLSAYAFNQANLVRVGDDVRAGQMIARMGQNNAGRTELYFEIRNNGAPVDPLNYLK